MFLKELSLHLSKTTEEEEATNHLSQRLAVAIHHGNAASVLGTMGPEPCLCLSA